MLKEVLSNGALTHYAVVGLVIFVVTFLGITVWILTRSKREVSTWSRIPLTGEDEGPLQPRDPDDPFRRSTHPA